MEGIEILQRNWSLNGKSTKEHTDYCHSRSGNASPKVIVFGQNFLHFPKETPPLFLNSERRSTSPWSNLLTKDRGKSVANVQQQLQQRVVLILIVLVRR